MASWHGGFCHAPPRPQRGTSPRATFSHSAFDHRSTIRHVSPAESRDGGRLEGASRIGVRDMLSCQSLMPAGAGTPRYEKPELWRGTANWHGGFCHAVPDPSGGQAPALHFLIPPSTIGLQLIWWRGTSPRATFSHSAFDYRSTIRHVSPAESRDGGRLEGASRIGVRDMLSYLDWRRFCPAPPRPSGFRPSPE